MEGEQEHRDEEQPIGPARRYENTFSRRVRNRTVRGRGGE
jgi:hypothetical protein